MLVVSGGVIDSPVVWRAEHAMSYANGCVLYTGRVHERYG